MTKKIILGSANFDQIYGLKKNLIKKKEIKKLLNFALKNKINTIDTSPKYGNAEKIIGNLNKNRFRIISKIPANITNIKKKNIKKWLLKNVKKSQKNLKIKKFECLLLHDANSLVSKNSKEIYKNMKNIKKKGLAKKIGLSIYDFNILDKILKKYKFDVIQIPFNILDNRLVDKGWLKKLKKRNIEVHVRSIFLQGILLLKHNQLPFKLKKLRESWIKWEYWLKKNQFSAQQACLSFVLGYRQLDGVIIGYDNKKQLNQILKLSQIKRNFSVPNLNIIDKKLIDPRQWFR